LQFFSVGGVEVGAGPAAAAEPGAMQLQLEQQEAQARGGMGGQDRKSGRPDALIMGTVN
jgi:hypothetical protein